MTSRQQYFQRRANSESSQWENSFTRWFYRLYEQRRLPKLHENPELSSREYISEKVSSVLAIRIYNMSRDLKTLSWSIMCATWNRWRIFLGFSKTHENLGRMLKYFPQLSSSASSTESFYQRRSKSAAPPWRNMKGRAAKATSTNLKRCCRWFKWKPQNCTLHVQIENSPNNCRKRAPHTCVVNMKIHFQYSGSSWEELFSNAEYGGHREFLRIIHDGKNLVIN